VACLWHLAGGGPAHRGGECSHHRPFGNTGWLVQAVAAAVATVVTLPYGVLVGVLLYLDLRARKENLTLERLRADLQASAA
jgi:hypothetical protein